MANEGLISNLLTLINPPKITGGGIQTDPTTGAISATPFQTSGYMSPSGKMALTQMYANIQQKAAELNNAVELAKMHGATEKDVANITGGYNLQIKQQEGTNATNLAKTQGEQIRQTGAADVVNSIAKENGITPEQMKDPSILQKVMQLAQNKMTSRINATQGPNYQDAVNAGEIGISAMPYAQMQKTMTTTTPEGATTTQFPGMFGQGLGNAAITLGATPSNSVYINPMTKMPMLVPGVNQGSYQPPISQAEVQKASAGGVNPYPADNPWAGRSNNAPSWNQYQQQGYDAGQPRGDTSVDPSPASQQNSLWSTLQQALFGTPNGPQQQIMPGRIAPF